MKISFGDQTTDRESRAEQIRALFVQGRTIPAHTDLCMTKGLWSESENYAAAFREHKAEVRDALGALTAQGLPFAGPTTTKSGRAPVWRQMEFWTEEDYHFNFNAYVGRANSNIEVANRIAVACEARYGHGPQRVHIVSILDEPAH
jgi:hypothetical protein